MTAVSPLEIMAALAAGLALGAAYFLLLHRAVGALAGGRAGALAALVQAGLRIGLAVAVFWLLAQWGGTALLVGAGGFTLAGLAARRLARPV